MILAHFRHFRHFRHFSPQSRCTCRDHLPRRSLRSHGVQVSTCSILVLIIFRERRIRGTEYQSYCTSTIYNPAVRAKMPRCQDAKMPRCQDTESSVPRKELFCSVLLYSALLLFCSTAVAEQPFRYKTKTPARQDAKTPSIYNTIA